MIITLFLIVVIEFSIYLILEFMNMRNQKLNDDDKLYNDGCRDICGSREDSGEGNETE